MKINEETYLKLILEDIKWLQQFPPSLEKDHIEMVLLESISQNYPEEENK